MKKIMLSLLAVGAMGCGSSSLMVYNPVYLRENEFSFSEGWDEEAGMYCNKSVYTGFEGGQLRSVLQVKHCINTEKMNGTYTWRRLEDRNADGGVDLVCRSDGYSRIGGKRESVPICNNDPDDLEINKGMEFVLTDALEWVKNPKYEF